MDDLPPKRTKPRVTTSKRWIERGPLAPWMFSYAQWLAEHPEAVLSRAMVNGERIRRGPPTTAERSAQANKLARRKIRTASIQTLERRPDFVDYFEKLRADAQFLAKEIARKSIVKNLEARDVALDRAMGATRMPDGTTVYGSVDYKAVEGFTRPFVEMAFPKKVTEESAKPRITINIGTVNPEMKALLGQVMGTDEEIADVEYEVIEPQQLEAGDE